MPIPIPISRTKIATVPWGIPLTNEVNRLTAATTPTPWANLTFRMVGLILVVVISLPNIGKLGISFTLGERLVVVPLALARLLCLSGFVPYRTWVFRLLFSLVSV